MEILSTHGVRTILPSGDVAVRRRGWKRKWMRGPKRPAARPDVAGNQRDYALSVMLCCEKHDRTSYMLAWLTASDETASGVWHSIPDKVICFECRVERVRVREGPWQRCPKCNRKMLTYVGVVSADLQAVARMLRKGEIRVE